MVDKGQGQNKFACLIFCFKICWKNLLFIVISATFKTKTRDVWPEISSKNTSCKYNRGGSEGVARVPVWPPFGNPTRGYHHTKSKKMDPYFGQLISPFPHNEWRNEWMSEWMNERTNEWSNERTKEWYSSSFFRSTSRSSLPSLKSWLDSLDIFKVISRARCAVWEWKPCDL